MDHLKFTAVLMLKATAFNGAAYGVSKNVLAMLLIEIVKNRKIIESGKKNTIDHQFAIDDFSMQIVNL